MRILDIRNELILAVFSTATCPGRIFTFDGDIKELYIAPISDNEMYKTILSELESSVVEVNSHVHIVLLQPKLLNPNTPLIIVPHGGPNSVYSVDYVFYPTVLASLGCAVASGKFKLIVFYFIICLFQLIILGPSDLGTIPLNHWKVKSVSEMLMIAM